MLNASAYSPIELLAMLFEHILYVNITFPVMANTPTQSTENTVSISYIIKDYILQNVY